MWPCCSFVCLAVGNDKKNKIIFSERDNPASVKDVSSENQRNRAYLMADACVFQTEDARDYFSDEIKAKGRVIPNPIKEGLPGPYTGERRKVIVNFCRLTSKKNLPLLIDAFAMLADVHPDYMLHIYGKGDLQDELLAYIAEKKMGQRIFILDHRSDIHETINDCSMFVSSSDYEGLSNSMIEAMAMGMPVVCTDCPAGGAKMFIKPYHNGILTPVGDANALHEAMSYMIDNPEEAARMGLNASEIKDELSVDRIAGKWVELIGE
jgi:glycosyltransferase involved in cell wall biosynthesis